MAEKTVRKSVTMSASASAFYDAEVKRQGRKGIRITVSELVRQAIAEDIKKRKRRHE